MTPQIEHPEKLQTNTFVLHDFTEIAYIVCSAAAPPTNHAATKTNSPHDQLIRLKNAAEQFKQASIIAVLDEEKLELFTFYKKLDVLKDQRAILQNFGIICRLNSCIIASKAACRTADLLRPENARLYRLFSEAILLNVELRSTETVEVRRARTHIYLVSSKGEDCSNVWDEFSSCRRWFLRQLQFQITSAGEILLLLKSTDWPALANMEEWLPGLEPSDCKPLNCTVYLMPFGQLARCNTDWMGVDGSNHGWDDKSRVGIRNAAHHFDNDIANRTCDWFRRHDISIDLTRDDLMMVEIAMLEGDSEMPETVWRNVLWPISLTYIFIQETNAKLYLDKFVDLHDPIDAAQEWCLRGATAMHQVDMTGQQMSDNNTYAEHTLEDNFDDDAAFGSQPPYMSQHVDLFIAGQAAYPTPPDLPGFHQLPDQSMMNGTVLTPDRSPRMLLRESGSYPEASDSQLQDAVPMMKDDLGPIDHDDDLFDDFDDHQLDNMGFDAEPNWNFFNPQDVDGHEILAHVGFDRQERDDTAISMNSPREHDSTTILHLDPIHDLGNDREMLESGANHMAEQAKSDKEISFVDRARQSQSANLEMPGEIRPASCTVTIPSGLQGPRLPPQDSKYAVHGKFWFPRQPSLRQNSEANDGFSGNLSDMSDTSSDDTKVASDDSMSRRRSSWMMPVSPIEKGTESRSSPAPEAAVDNTEEILNVIAGTQADEPFRYRYHESSRRLNAHSFDSQSTSRLAQTLLDTLTMSVPVVTTTSAYHGPIDRSLIVDLDMTGSEAVISSASLQDLATISTNHQQSLPTSRMSQLDNPKIRCRWNQSVVSVNSSIMRYWPVLGLDPLSGPKDIDLLLFYPTGRHPTRVYTDFLRQLSGVYSSSNFGFSQTLVLDGSDSDGLVCWDESRDSYSGLRAACERMAGSLAATSPEGSNVVVVMVASAGDPTELVGLCGAFQHLVDTLGGLGGSDKITTTLCITSVPHETAVEVEIFKMALNIYDRVRARGADVATSMACATEIDQPLGTEPRFELTANAASPLTRSGTCCHLAYSIGINRRWLVATWTDDLGSVRFTMPYQLPASGDEDFVLAQRAIFRQMCDISLHLMVNQRQDWWLALTKCGLYEAEEYQQWLHLAKQLVEEHATISRIVLLSTELDSRIQIHDASCGSLVTQGSSQPSMNTLNTPGTTPQAISTSPEQTMPATPNVAPTSAWSNTMYMSHDLAAEVLGSDTMLVDPLEDAWTVLLGLGLNQSNHHLQVRPALGTGLLVKRVRRGEEDSTGLAELCVNLLAVSGRETVVVSAEAADEVLHDVLQRYRGLHTLAIVKNMPNVDRHCLPWHVATAVEGTALLERLF